NQPRVLRNAPWTAFTLAAICVSVAHREVGYVLAQLFSVLPPWRRQSVGSFAIRGESPMTITAFANFLPAAEAAPRPVTDASLRGPRVYAPVMRAAVGFSPFATPSAQCSHFWHSAQLGA